MFDKLKDLMNDLLTEKSVHILLNISIDTKNASCYIKTIHIFLNHVLRFETTRYLRTSLNVQRNNNVINDMCKQAVVFQVVVGTYYISGLDNS